MNTIEGGKNAGCVRGFIRTTQAWYYDAKTTLSGGKLDEVMFGFYAPEGGTTGEMRMLWSDLGGKTVPELRVYDDAWSALAEFGDVLALMAAADCSHSDDAHVSGDKFCEMLVQCGFVDMTERVRDERPWLQQG